MNANFCPGVVLAMEAQDGLEGRNWDQKGSSKVPSGTPGVVFEGVGGGWRSGVK